MGNVVQFKYGADGLDPAAMESHDKPVDLRRMLLDVTVLHFSKNESSNSMPISV